METGTLWYDSNQLVQSVIKRPRSSGHKRAQTQKTAVIDNDRPKQLSAAVAKIKMELWDIDSSYGLPDFGSESDSSDPDIYSLQKQFRVG